MDLCLTTWGQLTRLLKYSVGIQWPIVCPERHSCWQSVCISSHCQKGWPKYGLFTVEMFSYFHMFLEQITYLYFLTLNIWTWLVPFIPLEFPFRPGNAKPQLGLMDSCEWDQKWHCLKSHKGRKTVFWDSWLDNFILKKFGKASLSISSSPAEKNITSSHQNLMRHPSHWKSCL